MIGSQLPKARLARRVVPEFRELCPWNDKSKELVFCQKCFVERDTIHPSLWATGGRLRLRPSPLRRRRSANQEVNDSKQKFGTV